MAKTKTDKASIFDFLAYLTYKKKDWSELTESDRKAFSPYMINRWLSMVPEFIDLVNQMQKHTIGQLSKQQVYEFYKNMLPPVNVFFKYIKGEKSDKYNKDLIKLISNHYWVSRAQAEEYADIYYTFNKLGLIDLIEKYGHDDKTVSKMVKKK